MENFHLDKPEEAEKAKIAALRLRYDDNELLHIIAVGNSVEATCDAAINLIGGLLERWTDDGRESDVLNLLMPDRKSASRCLEIPFLTGWIDYAIKAGKSPYDLVLNKLQSYYSDRKLAVKLTFLAKMKVNPVTMNLARQLLSNQEVQWQEKKLLAPMFSGYFAWKKICMCLLEAQCLCNGSTI